MFGIIMPNFVEIGHTILQFFSHVSNAIKNSLNGCTYYYTSAL